MKTSELNPTTKTLKQLGFKRRPGARRMLLHVEREIQIRPDVDWMPDAERVPQAPNYAGMWIDHFSNYGNIRSPLGSPLESGA